MSKRLYKSRNKVLCGVCGGIADYFNIDPTIIRLLTVVLIIAGFGTGIVIYIIAAVIMPDYSLDDTENLRSANIPDEERSRDSRSDDEFNSYFKK